MEIPHYYRSAAPRPSQETWEALRPQIARLLCHEGKTLKEVITVLRNEYQLLITEKPLKKKLKEWGLWKKLNHEDAADMSAAQERLNSLGIEAILLLRGRVEATKRILAYRRRAKNERIKTQCLSAAHACAFQMLCLNFEALIREQQVLLHTASENGWCAPSEAGILWLAPRVDMRTLQKQFERSIEEGTRAFEEGNVFWADACWHFALLQLNNLIFESDLDFWTTFIRCCLRLVRFGAADVGELLMRKTHRLRGSIPFVAPHRCLVYALTDLSLNELVLGGLFVLEAKLRSVQTVWPHNPAAHVIYQLNLAEERFYLGHQDYTADLPDSLSLWQPTDRNISGYINVSSNLVSCHMLRFEYRKAESQLRQCIADLERLIVTTGHAEVYTESLAIYYMMLGTAQYHEECDADIEKSYAKALEIHRKYMNLYGTRVFNHTQIYRILVVLKWLSRVQPGSSDQNHISQYHSLQTELQERFFTAVDFPSTRPFLAEANRRELTRWSSSFIKETTDLEDHVANQAESPSSRELNNSQNLLEFRSRANDVPAFTALDMEKKGGYRLSTQTSLAMNSSPQPYTEKCHSATESSATAASGRVNLDRSHKYSTARPRRPRPPCPDPNGL